jgi:hypothetical protein
MSMIAQQLLDRRRQTAAGLRKQPFNRGVALLLCGSILLAGTQSGCAADPNGPASMDATTTAVPVHEQPQELDQLVAPIALYPDALVAQILAASTFPSEVVEADRWMQQHSTLTADAVAREADKESWDASVKALSQFPAILANMDRNLSWTSALGEAYANDPQEVLNAVQVMRQRARDAGNLKNSPEERVTAEGQTIIIQPTDSEIVYLPEYDPWLVYGAPLVAYPGWVVTPGLYLDGPGLTWGFSFVVGAGFAWGWHHWGANWHEHRLDFDHHPYVSRGATFFHDHMLDRGADFAHRGKFHGGPFHGFAAPHSAIAVHSGAFSGFDHGGIARSYSFRGAASLGGFHGGFAGGFHGGGFHGGGGGHR